MLTLLGIVFGAVLFIIVAGEWLGLFEAVTEQVPFPVGLAVAAPDPRRSRRPGDAGPARRARAGAVDAIQLALDLDPFERRGAEDGDGQAGRLAGLVGGAHRMTVSR